MANFTTLATLDWANRLPEEFLQSVLLQSGVHKNYSIYDGVKSKMQIPIFSGQLTFGNDFCTFDPQSQVDITEKEFSTTNYKWAFKNCKTALQTTYKSLLLRKGANNDETIDAQFMDWIMTYFADLAGKKVGEVATAEIKTEIAADASVNKISGAAGSLQDSKDATKVLGVLKNIFSGITKEMYLSHFQVNGVTSSAAGEGLAFILPWEMYQAAHIALSTNLSFQERQEIEAGKLPLKYLGIPLIVNPDAADTDVIVSPLDNFVTVVDDIADVRAIQKKYIEELSSDYIWGQFTIGFSYKVSEKILAYTLVTS